MANRVPTGFTAPSAALRGNALQTQVYSTHEFALCACHYAGKVKYALAMRDIKKYFPFLAWPRPNVDLLRSEATAGLTVALLAWAAGLVDATAARVFSSGRSIEGLWAAVGLVVGLVWGGARRLSATALGFGIVALALAWATLTR